MTDVPSDGSSPGEGAERSEPTPGEAFQRLGDETRVGVLRTLAAEGPSAFSTLFEHSDHDTSAGFAYHLRQLDGFVRQRDDDRWELTAPGREAVRAVQAGRFTGGVDRDPVALEEHCPLCRESELRLGVSDSVAEVVCGGCDTTVARLSFPPAGDERGDDLPEAVDAYHRHRLRTFAEGVCPDCGGPVDSTVSSSPPSTADGAARVQFHFSCSRCEVSLDSPVTPTVLDHPTVVSFYENHGENPRERPLWNVGPEWREHVLSTDPWCLLVSTRLGDDVLELYVGDDGTVHAHRERPLPDEAEPAAGSHDSATGSTEHGDDAAA